MSWWKRRRRARILAQPFPAAWNAILERNVPTVAALDASERKTLKDTVRIFRFEGCGHVENSLSIDAGVCL
jgi:hypothetical protein